MDAEERAFRRMVVKALLSGPNIISNDELHSLLGIGKNMVAAARKELDGEQGDGEGASTEGGELIPAEREREDGGGRGSDGGEGGGSGGGGGGGLHLPKGRFGQVRQRSSFVTDAMRRNRKTDKFTEKHSLIRDFFIENSTPTSRTRDVVRIKNTKDVEQKRFLSDSLAFLYEAFVRTHGPTSRTLFYSLRPCWVVSPSAKDRQVRFNTVIQCSD